MIELTEEQRRELASPEPVAFDPQTRQVYVLVRKEIYDSFRGVLDEDDARGMAPLLANLDPEDWEDLAAYERKP